MATQTGLGSAESNRLHQKARQRAKQVLVERYPEEYSALVHQAQHDVGAPHIHWPAEHSHNGAEP